MQSPQLETKGQKNKQIAVSPQLETKSQQNKRIVQQNGKQSRQLRAKVIQRKQQNVKRSPQLESVQSETKSHQIKEMREQGDMQYRQSENLQNEHQPDNSKNQLQLVDTSCLDNSVATSQVMQYPQSDDKLKEHQPDNSQYQLQLVDTLHLDNSGDNSAANSPDLQSPQSGNVQNQHCSSKSYPQTDNYKYQQQLVDMSCKDNSAATSRYLQFQQSGNIQNGHQPDNNKNQAQLVDSSREDNSLASYLQSPQSGSEQHGRQTDNNKNGNQTDNNKNQPQLVDSSCLDDSVATSEGMQYPQSEKVQNQHQPDYNKYQPQLVGTSCLDNSVAASEANYPQSDNIQNQHCSGQPYPHLDIRTSQPQKVDIPHQESSTPREDLDSTSNRQAAKQSPQGLMESNQQQTSKPYPQLDIMIYQPQSVDTSRQESYDDPSSGKELVSTIDRVKSGAVYHALAQLEDQHVKEAADSVVLWNWTFNRLDQRPGILSTIRCHMAGEYLVVKGFNVNLTRVQIAERRVTPPDSVVMVTCSLENVMPAFVGKSNLGPKFMIPGAAYHNTIEDTLYVINTTGHCDTPSDTESEFRTALLYVMKIQALEPTTSYPPGLDDQCAAVLEHIQDILKCARSELTQYFHLQGSSFIEGIVGDTCALINYCQKAVMVTSSECSDPETSRIWDPGGATRFVKRRD